MRRQIPPTDGLTTHWRDFIVKRGDLSNGIATLLSVPVPVLTCSGTAALIIALRVLQQRNPGRSRVIVPGYTCPLVVLAAHYCPSLQIIACDLAPESLNMDADALAAHCDSRTLAVVVTHLGGRVADCSLALAIARQHGAAVIEDAAQSMGAMDKGISAGLQGDIGFFSLAPGKGLTSGEGGVLFSRDPELHQALAKQAKCDLSLHLLWEIKRTLLLAGYCAVYRPDRLDWFYGRPLRQALLRNDDIAATGDDFSLNDIPLHSLGNYRQRVAACSLSRLSAHWHSGRQRAIPRLARLKKIPGMQVFADNPDQQGVWPFFMIMLPSAQARDTALSKLWDKGLGVTRLFAHAVSDYPALSQMLLPGTTLTNARNFAARTMTITHSGWLSDAEFEHICLILTSASCG
ncbi:DegT/DnrJ/EryC1/StrS family aminotransferase [Enterobacteriaceae bacterium LUAb1]